MCGGVVFAILVKRSTSFIFLKFWHLNPHNYVDFTLRGYGRLQEKENKTKLYRIKHKRLLYLILYLYITNKRDFNFTPY